MRATSHLELWGGVECTHNRVGDAYFDQCERSGHAARLSDLDRFAELGIRALRYPVLWERTAPNGPTQADWSWADERLLRLRALGMRPIVGLVHHGSGPRWTSLVDPAFPAGLAEFAGAAAARYPWVQDWTPVNEPLTTARFSGLYGHWYPHGADDRTFIRALLIQCRAVVLAMRAIRKVVPDARLIQTDDLGKTWSTPSLVEQAEFENVRRWLSFDLLAGRLERDHPLWSYLRWAGAEEAELLWFVDHPCPPDVIGINHYLSSERFLDERLEPYPVDSHGGNGRQRYADVLAARVRRAGAAGLSTLLHETWERYRLPIAVTETHNGCTREEQLRWLKDVWDAAQHVRAEGVDLRAVTVWSLLGVHGWNNLVTRPDGVYEPGAFDLRGSYPRPTALAGLIRDLAAGQQPSHPLYSVPGWWRRPERLIYGFAVDDHGRRVLVEAVYRASASPSAAARPILIVGRHDTLGLAFEQLCAARGLPFQRPAHAQLAGGAAVDALLDEFEPWAVVNTGDPIGAGDMEQADETPHHRNTDAATALAAACAQRGIALLWCSSAHVFEGGQGERYVESSAVAPSSAYGHRQAEAEVRVREALPDALVVRIGACLSPGDEQNMVTLALGRLACGLPVVAADDAAVSLSNVPDVVHACLDLLIDGEHGIWHLAHPGSISWAELLRRAAEAVGVDASSVVGCPAAQLRQQAQQLWFGVLDSERGVLLPPLEEALQALLEQLELPLDPASKNATTQRTPRTERINAQTQRRKGNILIQPDHIEQKA